MYWPIGGPRAYEQELPNHPSQLSHDGINGPEKKSIRTISQDAIVYNGPSRSPVDQTTKKNSWETTSIPDQEDNGDIIGMRVARQGHLFATITFSSLTVWQTKVLSPILAKRIMLSDRKRPAHSGPGLSRPFCALSHYLWTQR